MSQENDGGGVDCNVEGCFRLWRRFSRLGRWRSTNGDDPADVEVIYRPSQPHPKKGKSVTFALDWDDRYDEVLCQRCRTQMQTHYHGELCGRCGAIFTINRPWSLPELKTHHGLAHGTSAPSLKSVLREANHHKRQELLRMANADQINAISELVMNTLRGTVAQSRHTITLLKAHAQSLRAMAKPAHLVKRRRAIMMAPKGGSLWSELNVVCVSPVQHLRGHHGTRDGEHARGQCHRVFTITRQIETRFSGRHSFDQSCGFGGQTTHALGQRESPRRLETPSTQSRRTAITPLDQKGPSTVWFPRQRCGWSGCSRHAGEGE